MPMRVFLPAILISLAATAVFAQQPAGKTVTPKPGAETGSAPQPPASTPPSGLAAVSPSARTRKPSRVVPKSPAKKPRVESPRPSPSGTVASESKPAVEPLAADAVVSSGLAREKEELRQLRGTTLNLIRLLVEQGILTRDKAEQLVQEAERASIAPGAPVSPPLAGESSAGAQDGVAAAAPLAEEGSAATETPATRRARRGSQVVRVPYVPELVRNQIRDEVREEVLAQAKTERWGEPGTMPAWLDRISLDGDLRFRYQGNYYSESNSPVLQYNALTGSNLGNTTVDESRFAVRARFGVNAKISEPLFGRVSFTTGNALNPISLNQNLGNSFSGYGAQIDQAYLRYTPAAWASGSVGRMPKPFVSTELMFWEDINMDGAAATLRRKLDESSDLFLTGGAFLVQKSPSSPTTPNPKTKSLLALQLGGSVEVTTSTRFNAALGYYDYQNIEGIPNASLNSREFDWSAPQFRQKGNTLFNIDNDGDPTTNTFALASKFKIVDLNVSADLAHFDPYIVRLSGNYLQNIGFDRDEVRARTGRNIDPHASGFQASVLVGKLQISQLHDWHAFVIYRRLQRDAVVDAFNDPDFNLGGTNHKGYQIGLRYGIGADTWLRLRWTSADQIDAMSDATQPVPTRFSADVVQIDLNTRF